MNAEFHYHVNAIVARLAGFSAQESCIIASSSQFVDDNCKSIAVQLEDRIYRNIITQTLNISLSSQELSDIYTVFHFQPQGGHENFWITKPNAPIARRIFSDALATNNLYMIGIASHAFADAYAHQDFIGHNNQYNTPISNIPSYGHMYYLELPDLVAVKWKDIRTQTTINNNGDSIPEYGPQKWQRRAIYYSGIEKTWRATHNFENSHWHNFQEQAKRYKSLALGVINENLAKYKRIT